MFDRFTDNAKRAMNLARQESQRLNHEYLGTEHILLGLLRLEGSLALRMLERLTTTDPRRARVEVEKNVEMGPKPVTAGQLPFTPRAKKVLELSMEEAGNLRDNFIGSEHLLLGLIREGQGVGARVIASLGVTAERARTSLLELRADSGYAPPPPKAPARDVSRENVIDRLRAAIPLLRQMHEHAAADKIEGILRELESKG